MRMMHGETIDEKGVFYCKECNKIYMSCYELEGVNMCPRCFEDVEIIPPEKIQSFIRAKRLKKLKENEH